MRKARCTNICSFNTNCIIDGALLYVCDLFMEIQEISRGGELSDVWQRTVEHCGLLLFLFFF